MPGYPATPTYWIEPTDEVAWGLRRYHSAAGSGSDCASGFHDALVYLGRAPAVYNANGYREISVRTPHTDPRWPKRCSSCDYEFTDADRWQEWDELIYRRPADGAEFVLHQNAPATELGIPSAPPGACWNAWWMPSAGHRPDGMYLMVRLPNGHDWSVDSEASNCTRKGEPHECWVRHGDPRECRVTVDKNGDTCAAGAGSILAHDYHGFLHDGVLTAG